MPDVPGPDLSRSVWLNPKPSDVWITPAPFPPFARSSHVRAHIDGLEQAVGHLMKK